jgi:hypothetical protein
MTRRIESEVRRLKTTLGPLWRATLSEAARQQTPWPLDFVLFIWSRLPILFSPRSEPDSPPAAPEPDWKPLLKGLADWQEELTATLTRPPDERKDDGPAQAFEQALAVDVQSGTIDQEARLAWNEAVNASTRGLARRFHWRISHHLLPLLILAYPVLPMFAAWLGERLWGYSPVEGGPAPWLIISWRELLTLIEMVAGVYLVETIYYAFSLEKAAGRAWRDLVQAWREISAGLGEQRLTRPLEQLHRDFLAEIEKVEILTRKMAPNQLNSSPQ